MTMRTTKSSVTFARPFRLDAFGAQFPAGRYIIETDEELLEGLSFAAYHRTAITMQLGADARHPGITEYAVIDPSQLDTALSLDAAPVSASETDEMLPPSLPGRRPELRPLPQPAPRARTPRRIRPA